MTKRRVDRDITFCWLCGSGWEPDNGLLHDGEMPEREPSNWLQMLDQHGGEESDPAPGGLEPPSLPEATV